MHLIVFRFVVVCGDGEYIIYTAMALRNKAFGPAQEFVWAQDSSGSEYAIRENSSSIKLFKNFKEKRVFKPEFGAECKFGICMSPCGFLYVYIRIVLICGFVNKQQSTVDFYLESSPFPVLPFMIGRLRS